MSGRRLTLRGGATRIYDRHKHRHDHRRPWEQHGDSATFNGISSWGFSIPSGFDAYIDGAFNFSGTSGSGSGIASIVFNLGDGDDNLTVTTGNPAFTSFSAIPITVNLGAGTDTLKVDQFGGVTFNIDSAGGGTFGTSKTFAGVENLLGGGRVDLFTVAATGSITSIDGAAAIDQITFNTDYAPTGATNLEIGGNVAGSSYEQIAVNGSVALGAGTTALTLSGSYVPTSTDRFVLIANYGSDAVTGFFTGVPEGSAINVNGSVLYITYQGGDGNDVGLFTPLYTPDIASVTTDEDTAATGLVISANTDDLGLTTHFKITGITNGTLFQNDGITKIQDGDFITLAQGTAGLEFQPDPNLNGVNTTTFGFTAQAATGSTDSDLEGSTATAQITVNEVNDPPTLSVISNPAPLPPSSGQQTINLSDISAGPLETQTVTITATSDNHALIPDPTATYSSPGTTGSLSFMPLPYVGGTAEITVTVFDGQATNHTTVRTFTVTVPAVNDVAFVTGKKAVTIDVLANDVGLIGTIALSIGTPPVNGTATIVNGKVLYTPNGTLPKGGDQFTYLYDDDNGNTGTATVNVVNYKDTTGVYDGLVEATPSKSGLERHERSGYLRITVSKSGSFSGVLTLAGTKLSGIVRTGFRGYGFNSQLGTVGEVVHVIARRPRAPVTFKLQFDAVNRTISGTVESTDSGGQTFTSPLTLARQSEAGLNAGSYTLLIGPDSTPDSPQGTGYAVATIKPAGTVTVKGKLADGAAFSSSTTFHEDESFPIYSQVYTGGYADRGSLRGLMTFGRLRFGDASGDLIWFKPVRPQDDYYPAGFDLERNALLARYERPAKNTRLLDFDPVSENGLATLNINGTDEDQLFTLLPSNQVTFGPTNPRKLTLSFTGKTGLFQGTFVHPTTQKAVTFYGAVLQDAAMGAGYFLDPTTHEGFSVLLERE